MTTLQIKSRPRPGSINTSINPVLATVLANRGIKEPNDLDLGLKNLLPPTGLSHIDLAAELLSEAITAAANVVIIGDFDADGATSCALAVRCLKAFGLDSVSYLVPNRFEFGYGLSPEIVGVAATRQPDVIVTVDNGISSVDGVHAAQALGMSVLITDHHLPGEQIPTADVIVNPNLPGDKFASKNLAGVGVIFYVMLALRAKLRAMGWFEASGIKEPNMSQFLDLVALGTVADVVPLDRNNRILVQQGLQRIRNGQACEGIKALLAVGNRNTSRLATADLGFVIGPRLNAAGRLDDMSIGIEALLADDPSVAMCHASQLDELNKERKQVEQSMQQDALGILSSLETKSRENQSIYLLHNESWHQGVVGLVASRMKERLARPVIAMAPGDCSGEWKGSARSVEGVHIRDLLARLDAVYPGLMVKFGGHAMAAGMSIKGENLERFGKAISQITDEFTQSHDWSQTIWTDGSLSADDFTIEMAELLRQSSPWGQGFPEPVFDGNFEVMETRIVGLTHLKMRLRPTNSNQLVDGICFGYMENNKQEPSGHVRLAYKLDVNEFRDRLTLQLIIQHIE